MNYAAQIKQIDSYKKQLAECISKIATQEKKKADLETKIKTLQGEVCLDLLETHDISVFDIIKQFDIEIPESNPKQKRNTTKTDVDKEDEVGDGVIEEVVEA